MNKKEIIKQAYGDLYFDGKDIDENGWTCLATENLLNTITCDYKSLQVEFGREIHFYRPISLRGIEDNNGWIKIESEDDLPMPEIGVECYFIIYDKEDEISNTVRGYTDKTGKYFIDTQTYAVIRYDSIFCKVTHYKPIEKPKPPIY